MIPEINYTILKCNMDNMLSFRPRQVYLKFISNLSKHAHYLIETTH
jgi:hypothetical protein